MCGIAGFEWSERDGALLAESLLDSLKNRGPDGRHFGQHGDYGLVQTRLAVIDLSDRVRYPMSNESGDLWLVFNGEIYGFTGLRKELEGLGHRFRTDCDAEVIVHGYEEWGLDLFPRLNGMFALALVDERRHEITLARDASGIKPLVRTKGPRFGFASDALALVSAGLSAGQIDRQAIAEYSSFHYVPQPGTGVVDLEQVEPGTAFVRRRDGSEVVSRWRSRRFDGPPAAENIAPEELNQTLLEAVTRQLVADVEVGVFLSGGVDSSLLAALAVEAGARPRAFTISFHGHGDYDESSRAKLLARSLGIPHHVKSMDVGFLDAVDQVCDAYDQPFADSSALPTLFLSRLASSEVKVALSGTGGDDLFAGYYRHRAHKFRRAIQFLPNRLVKRLSNVSVEQGAERRDVLRLANSYMARLARAGGENDHQQYLDLVAQMSSPAALAALCNVPGGSEVRLGVAHRLGLENPASGTVLRELQRFELQTYLPGDLLTKEDRASMAFGLEARVPLLDEAVVAMAERMPDRQKLTWLGGKLPLRELARSKLPAHGRSGRKRGFAVPLHDLFSGPWRGEARTWLRESDSSLVNGGVAANLLDSESQASDVWALAILIAWEERLRECRKSGYALR